MDDVTFHREKVRRSLNELVAEIPTGDEEDIEHRDTIFSARLLVFNQDAGAYFKSVVERMESRG